MPLIRKDIISINDAATGLLLFSVRMPAGVGYGSGFIMTSIGYAITCNHVIDGAIEIKARVRVPGRIGGSDTWHTAKVVKADNKLDIALVKLEGYDFPSNLPANPVGSESETSTVGTKPEDLQERTENCAMQIPRDLINTIFRNCDLPVNWFEAASNIKPTSDEFNADTWDFLHKNAVGAINGDIDTYLQIIEAVNPYNDLLDYAECFEVGLDDDKQIVIYFTIIAEKTKGLTREALDDYVSAITIRTARDTFALLPLDTVKVEALLCGSKCIDATFERDVLSDIITGKSDASDIISRFADNQKSCRS